MIIEHRVNPAQLHGIEINDYAAELARVSIWIGYLTWHRVNYQADTGRRPILDALDTIEHRDAILDWRDEKNGPMPTWRHGAACAGPATWPEAEFIIGNPPFLGSKLFRKHGLSDPYLDALYKNYDLPNTSDLCCYWFELARQRIAAPQPSAATKLSNPKPRVGLLATQGIRGRENRTVLDRIKHDGDIYMGWSDRAWILDGAAVHVSMVAFDDGTERVRTLDGTQVATISADLRSTTDTSGAAPLSENANIVFMGTTKGGGFDMPWIDAALLLGSPNPNQRSNADVLKPWINGSDVSQRNRGYWIVDYGVDRTELDASKYHAIFQTLEARVKPDRTKNRRQAYAESWWLHVEPRPALREAVSGLSRFLVTPRVSKYRLFNWFSNPTLPDSATFAFARSDDYFFGVLHSAIHEVWARRVGTQLREVESGFRYTPTTCFETFPLPWTPGKEPSAPRARHRSLWLEISEAAKELNELRENWLNPPEWIAQVRQLVDIKYRNELAAVPDEVRPLVRHSAVMAEACSHEAQIPGSRRARRDGLKHRTLTNLYNERPAWLRHAHKRLDRAVLAAYAAVDPQGNWNPDWADVYEPFGAGEIEVERKPAKKRLVKKKRTARPPAAPNGQPDYEAARTALAARKPIDEQILGNLLRLNAACASSAGEEHHSP